MARHNELGKWGEQYAADYLQDNGYEILDRDWRIGHRDIDIIARTNDGTTIVFVEVKTRTSDVVRKPDDAVDLRKIRNIGYAANNYVKPKALSTCCALTLSPSLATTTTTPNSNIS